ncbi:uracil-DNA glycosylase [Candidatus Pacearchaeota archaeon]|nr:uracil-DNA glycosylase [Candidatus Pacearchaeota archaeon]
MEQLKDTEEFKQAMETEICQNCLNFVFGKGNEKADIVFVGEAPGAKEDLEGLPFVGAAGKNLDKLLEGVGLSLDDVYVTNILKCRPPENRDPNAEEMEAHTPFLVRQLEEVKPKVVCSLGNYATKFFLTDGVVGDMKKQPGITEVHGKVREMDFRGMKIILIPLFHPAALIYNRKLLPLWEDDMEIVKGVLSGEVKGEKQETLV